MGTGITEDGKEGVEDSEEGCPEAGGSASLCDVVGYIRIEGGRVGGCDMVGQCQVLATS